MRQQPEDLVELLPAAGPLLDADELARAARRRTNLRPLLHTGEDDRLVAGPAVAGGEPRIAAAAASLDELADATRHFEFFVFPHSDVALTRTNEIVDEAPRPPGPAKRWVDDIRTLFDGLDASGAVVLRELRTSVVHLAPSPVVARVAPVSVACSRPPSSTWPTPTRVAVPPG